MTGDRYLDTLDAEAALLGAVLRMTAPEAVAALDLVTAEDFTDLRIGRLIDVCRQVAESGVQPDPVALLAAVRRHAVFTGVSFRDVGLLIFDCLAGCPVPAGWHAYLVAVLEESVRRRVAMLATRVGQAADHDSLGTVVDLLDHEARAVREVLDRRTAADGETSPARLRAVPS